MKTNFASALLAAACCLCAQAQAGSVVLSGNTTTGATFNRPLEDLSALSSLGTGVHYNVYQFSVSAAGSYNFVTTSLQPDFFDPFVVLYGQSFNSSAPLANALIANDDFQGSQAVSGFDRQLAAGATYAYVTTGFSSTDYGSFTTTISGPGVIAAVPEVETSMLMLLGLAGLCARRKIATKALCSPAA